jgi:hypothetical protein
LVNIPIDSETDLWNRVPPPWNGPVPGDVHTPLLEAGRSDPAMVPFPNDVRIEHRTNEDNEVLNLAICCFFSSFSNDSTIEHRDFWYPEGIDMTLFTVAISKNSWRMCYSCYMRCHYWLHLKNLKTGQP